MFKKKKQVYILRSNSWFSSITNTSDDGMYRPGFITNVYKNFDDAWEAATQLGVCTDRCHHVTFCEKPRKVDYISAVCKYVPVCYWISENFGEGKVYKHSFVIECMELS